MSAELLRKAATILRERAEAATPGPWVAGLEWAPMSSGPDSVFHGYYVGECPNCGDDLRDDAKVAIEGTDADYIATMHPGVGLALADWLDQSAYYATSREENGVPVEHSCDPRPLAVARLIVGP